MSVRPARVVFMGSPQFAIPSLRALAHERYDVAAAVCQPDRPAGRGSKLLAPAVKMTAVDLGIEVFQPETLRDAASQARLDGYAADVFVVAAYGKILPRAVLAMPWRGCVNVHASLLPRWRGASPINAAILAGDAETGVSIIEMEPTMDTGPVIVRRPIHIEPNDTTATLEPRLAALGAAALIDALPTWIDADLQAEPQDESLVTYCSLIKKEDGHLARTMTAVEAERAVRAYDPWPMAVVMLGEERLAIWAAHVVEAGENLVPGSLFLFERRPAVALTGGGLVLDEVQRPGSRRLSGDQFLNGLRGQLPATVGLRD
jgi:methionyl-tRNA formyltransferase